MQYQQQNREFHLQLNLLNQTAEPNTSVIIPETSWGDWLEKEKNNTEIWQEWMNLDTKCPEKPEPPDCGGSDPTVRPDDTLKAPKSPGLNDARPVEVQRVDDFTKTSSW